MKQENQFTEIESLLVLMPLESSHAYDMTELLSTLDDPDWEDNSVRYDWRNYVLNCMSV